jgi:hypothetical protein
MMMLTPTLSRFSCPPVLCVCLCVCVCVLGRWGEGERVVCMRIVVRALCYCCAGFMFFFFFKL